MEVSLGQSDFFARAAGQDEIPDLWGWTGSERMSGVAPFLDGGPGGHYEGL